MQEDSHIVEECGTCTRVARAEKEEQGAERTEGARGMEHVRRVKHDRTVRVKRN